MKAYPLAVHLNGIAVNHRGRAGTLTLPRVIELNRIVRFNYAASVPALDALGARLGSGR